MINRIYILNRLTRVYKGGLIHLITIKQYAESRNKSVQAVYQQIKRKENAARLDGHIHISKIGNKDTKFLDDVAVEILDESSQKSVQIIEQTNDKEKIAELENEVKVLLMKNAALNEKMNGFRDLLDEVRERNHQLELENANMKMLLESNQEQQNVESMEKEIDMTDDSKIQNAQEVQEQDQTVHSKSVLKKIFFKLFK